MLLKKYIIPLVIICLLNFGNYSNSKNKVNKITKSQVKIGWEIEKTDNDNITIENIQKLNEYALKLEREENLKNSKELLEKILEKFPNDVATNLNYGDVLWRNHEKEKSAIYYKKYVEIMIKKNREEKILNSVLEKIYLAHGIDLNNNDDIELVNKKYSLKLKNNWNVDYNSYKYFFGQGTNSIKFAYTNDRYYLKGNSIFLIDLFKEDTFVFDTQQSLKDLKIILKYKLINTKEHLKFHFYNLDFKDINSINFSNADDIIFNEISNLPKINFKNKVSLWIINLSNPDIKLGKNISDIKYEELEELVITEYPLLELLNYNKNIFARIKKIQKIIYGDIYSGFEIINTKKQMELLRKYFKEEYKLDL